MDKTKLKCAECNLDDIEIFGANIRWIIWDDVPEHSDRIDGWNIVNEDDAQYQCYSCEHQGKYTDINKVGA